jgi:aspartate racemase
MKTVGIIGGIAPESTIEYYRLIIARYREQKGDGSYPSVIINSIDLTKMLGFVTAGDLAGLAAYLMREVKRLAGAGADFGLFASNTPNIVFKRGIDLVVPGSEDQEYIHEKYMSELVNAVFLPQTRTELLRIVGRLREQSGIEAVILGGTELPLILRDVREGEIPFLDTTRIHAEEAVGRLLAESDVN